MKKYYLHDGEEQAGPFSLEDLKQQALNPTDMVWYEGQNEWQEAASIDALSPLFNRTTPPPLVKKAPLMPPAIGSKNKSEVKSSTDPLKSPQPPLPPPRRKPGGFIIFLIVAAILITALVMYLKTKDPEETVSDEITYEEKVLSIEEQERSNPVRFVKASGTFKKLIFGGKYKINGTITNKATVAKYKNVVVQVTFYSGTKAPLGSERHTIEDEFLPGQTKEFKLKVDPPRGAESCRWTAVAATPN